MPNDKLVITSVLLKIMMTKFHGNVMTCYHDQLLLQNKYFMHLHSDSYLMLKLM